MSYEPAIDCCALCAAVGVTAVGYMQQSVMFLECKVLMHEHHQTPTEVCNLPTSASMLTRVDLQCI